MLGPWGPLVAGDRLVVFPGGVVSVVGVVGVALLSVVVGVVRAPVLGVVVGVPLPSEIVGVNIPELSIVCLVHIRVYCTHDHA